MKTIINLIAVTNDVENCVLNSITNFNDAEQQTKLFENSTKLWALEIDNAKTARRWIYDLCRLLRHDIANGKNCVSIPAEIADLMNTANTKFDRTNTDFGTKKSYDDGVLTICLRGITYLVLRTYPKPEKPETAAPETTNETTETAAPETTENVSYTCKLNAANKRILKNHNITFDTDNDTKTITFTTTNETFQTLKIKTL